MLIYFKNEKSLGKREASEKMLHKFRKLQLIYRFREQKNLSVQPGEKDYEEITFNNRVVETLNLLDEDERKILILRYLKNNGRSYDYIVKNEMGLSRATYYRIKKRALETFYEIMTNRWE